jgi:poly-gamma-glutamate synthesis protein (capsule biosynthesis protein)
MKIKMNLRNVIAWSVFATATMATAQTSVSDRDLSFSGRCQSPQDTAVISFIGDVLIHEDLYTAVVRGSGNFSQLWKKIEPLWAKADYSVGNLEGPTAPGVNRRGKEIPDVGARYDGEVYSGTNFSFNFHPRIWGDMKQSGLDLMTAANNHTLDRQSIGVDKTIEQARKTDFPTTGIRHSQERNSDFHYIANVKGLNIAFIGCTEKTNGHKDEKNQVLWCYKQADLMVDTIRRLSSRSDVDAVVVLPHWGEEYKPLPNSNQKKYARMFLEAGATAIIGSHPHVLQPWEKYVTQDGRETLIAYSLGNFVAYQASLEKKTAALIYLGLTKSAAGKAQISGVAYAPIYRNGFEVYPLFGSTSREAQEHAAQSLGLKNKIGPQTSVPAQICGSTQLP